MITYTLLELILNDVLKYRKHLRKEVPVSGTKYLTRQKMTCVCSYLSLGKANYFLKIEF